ncbi:unnamed protein product [Acanthosepion pharaonis]|uniref:Uncharacterized protein n=1 Tax=Acanthosepion pharaonis TaxID=158019 RepID=A0A812CLP3_ACAPH|nr:unnamed protein product [Sepia pharaonis]
MGKRKTGWSKCSAKYFKLWLRRGRGKCLMEENVRIPQKPKQKWSFNVNTYGSGLLPAMYRSRDRYCEEKFGKGFGYISLYPEKICEIQSCAMLEPGPQFGAIRVDEEGIDGLYCGLGKIGSLKIIVIVILTHVDEIIRIIMVRAAIGRKTFEDRNRDFIGL